MAADDGLFEPFVMEVASACAEAGFPDYASELIDAVVGLGGERLSSLLASSGPPLRTSPVDVKTTEALADLLGRDVDGVLANGVVLPFSDADVSFVAVSSEDDAWFHGMRLTSVPGSPVVVDLRRIEAEALLYRCQSSIVGGLVTVRGREALEASGFARVLGCTMVPSPSVDDVLADFGLRKGRLTQSRDLIRAVMAARGRFRGVSPHYRVDMDLRRKGSRITTMEADNPFRSAFVKVEFDPCITDERFGYMSDGFSRIADAGYAVTRPVDLLALRFRRFASLPYGGFYSPLFRDVVVRADQMYFFMHEYGHAVDYTLGGLSSSPSFRQVLDDYGRYASESGILRMFDPRYILDPPEVFARCMELYVERDICGNCLTRALNNDFPLPVSPELRGSVESYFEALFADRSAAPPERVAHFYLRVPHM